MISVMRAKFGLRSVSQVRDEALPDSGFPDTRRMLVVCESQSLADFFCTEFPVAR